MSGLWTVFRRELGAYFNSAIAVIFLIVFVVFTNGLYMLQFFPIGKADMRILFGSLPFALNIFIPAVSMRLWTEDKKGNTFELLMTFPLRPYELVLGKFLASFVFYLFALVTTLTVPLMLHMIGRPDAGPILGGYLGAIFSGALFLAVGIFISGLCKDQIVAFILTMIATFAFFFTGTDLFASFLDGWTSGLGSFVKDHVGMASHLDGFSKGVIDLRDLLYFLVMTSVFLFLNGLSLEGRFRPRARMVFSGAVVVCVLSAVLVNWLTADVALGRFDLTEGRAYTVSGASAKILKNLKVPVTAKLFITPSDSMPTALKTLEREVTDKLEELKRVSDNKFKYKVTHVEALQEGDETLRKTLQGQGVAPFQVESIQRDEVGVKLIYSTLIIEYKEKTGEALPRVVPQTLHDLEYQLLSRIYKMTLEEKPRIAIFAPVKEEMLSEDLNRILAGEDDKPQKRYEDEYKTASLLIRNNGYEVSRIALGANDPIPEKTNMLIALKPGRLSERQRYEINKYLYQGGTLFLAAQSFEFTFAREERGVEAVPQKLDLDINRLIEKWGVKINEEMLFDENSQVISLTTGQTVGPFALQMPVKFPNQIIVEEANINRSASVTSRVPSLAYLWGSSLDLADAVMKPLSLKATVLFTSSARSWKVPNDGSVRLTAENTRPPANFAGKLPLAALIEGQFTDTFGGNVPVWTEGEAVEQEKLEGAKPGRLLVVGDSRAFSEDLIQTPGNLNLFANIIDGLALGEDLVQIRSKTVVTRDIRRLTTAEKLWYKFFTVLMVPLVLVIVAVVRIFLRKKEKEFYLSAAGAASP